MLNEKVKNYWSEEVCGTHSYIISSDVDSMTDQFFMQIEKYRYRVEPFILDIARFEELRGKQCLEIGVGAGTDHARIAAIAGASHTFGIDLTENAVEASMNNLAWRGLSSNIMVMDAENLQFKDNSFDYIWSWGVIHHSENIESVVKEIVRVLKPGGSFRGMIYNKHSLAVYRNLIRTVVKERRLLLDLDDFIANHIESPGTKAYSLADARKLLSAFSKVELKRFVTESDTGAHLSFLRRFIPSSFGWYLSFVCEK